MKKISLTALAVFVLIFMFMSAAQAQSLQETLNQYISDLQKNPNDYALREKIIRLVQTMKPAPAIPLEAERFEGRAEFAIKNAKSEADFLDAAKEYEKALHLAPWASAYYFNQGIAYEKAGKFKEAKQSFEFYLLAEPNAKDSKDVRKRIAGLEFALEKAAKDKELAAKKAAEEKRAQQEDAGAKKAKQQEEFLRKINGARYIFHGSDGNSTLDVLGDTITEGMDLNVSGYRRTGLTYKIDGRTLHAFRNGTAEPERRGVIAEDGSTITIIGILGSGEEFRRLYKRER